MTSASKRLAAAVAIGEELAAIYSKRGGLRPEVVVAWAREHPGSALHGRFVWDDTKAAHAYRLWQARDLITEVEVTYPDGKVRQVYVSPVEARGRTGYSALVDVLSDSDRRESFLAQALAEYERVGAKYQDLLELAEIRAVVKAARKRNLKGRKNRAA